ARALPRPDSRLHHHAHRAGRARRRAPARRNGAREPSRIFRTWGSLAPLVWLVGGWLCGEALVELAGVGGRLDREAVAAVDEGGVFEQVKDGAGGRRAGASFAERGQSVGVVAAGVALDQRVDHQREAADGEQRGDAIVVLDEQGPDAQRPLERAVSALDA